VATSSPLGAVIPKLVWAVLWLGFAALSLENVNRSPSALHDAITGLSPGEPGWIKTLNRGLAAPLTHHGTEWSIVLAILFALVAVGVFVPTALRPALVVAVVLGVAIWLAEDFGEIPTGSATDVNSGPLLVLLAACYWPARTLRQTRARTATGVASGETVPLPAETRVRPLRARIHLAASLHPQRSRCGQISEPRRLAIEVPGHPATSASVIGPIPARSDASSSLRW
jgi:hypothetical protein